MRPLKAGEVRGVPSRRYRAWKAGPGRAKVRAWAAEVASLAVGASVVLDIGPDHRVAARVISSAISQTGGAGAFASRATSTVGAPLHKLRRFWRTR